MNNYGLFLKHNSKEVRKKMPTDFYTSQDFEKLIYNLNKLKENYIKIQEEENAEK